MTHDVSGFFTTAGDALSTAGVSVGAHDLVAPASDQSVANGDTVVVRTATEYDVTVDGNRTTAWSTASSISGVLSALPASSATMAADRSYTRAEMPLAEHGETIHASPTGPPPTWSHPPRRVRAPSSTRPGSAPDPSTA